ncbi:hypothetical protein G6M89_04780 [Natronolimnobius sp. AArcel1]|uniref:hypothetical protein n=1 Tax=Natronolimnobius sp. AArcel1 TaxID=1679093 RepID=UPI0013ED273C|nr:hypothetical protein [Natronolimnobius sp. AArcel1]NGM68330.1 hypothetical protein [Natronolimnobius sp. AArcel1]
MKRPTRRRVLHGVSTGAVVLGTAAWTQNRHGQDRGTVSGHTDTADATADLDLDSDGERGALEVSIRETNAPVGAGEYLDVTAEIENTSGSNVRADVALLIGDDQTENQRITTTIDAGETHTMTLGFYTYPVPSDDEFPVRVAVDGDSADETVSVIGASSLSAGRPDPTETMSVQPDTTVMFEAVPDDPDESQQTVWWVDGEHVSAMDGPWEWAYLQELGAHFRQETFETPGTHDVAVAVLPHDRDETYTIHWHVEVTESGHHAPTVEAIRPDLGTVPASGDDITFELEASDPATSLERVVWWLTQADVIVGTSDLSGTRDTAQLVTDSTCHTCHVVPWVICSDGTVAELDGDWQLEAVEDDNGDEQPGPTLDLSIRHADSPVDAGEYLEVIIDIENTGTETGEDVLELVVGHDPEVLDTQEIIVEPGETGAATLGFETYPTRQDEEFPIRVVGADDTVETTVQVHAQ